MSADVLNRAAAQMRDEASGDVGTGDYLADTLSATADWLEQMALCWTHYEGHAIRNTALVTARTFLGESA